MKRQTVENFLQSSGVTRLYVQPRGCLVPARLQQCTWILVDLEMPPAIPDLLVQDVGVYGTLKFGSEATLCFVPWASVHAAKHVNSGTIVSWTSEATAFVRAQHEAVYVPTPSIHEEPNREERSNVVDLRQWATSRGRRWGMS